MKIHLAILWLLLCATVARGQAALPAEDGDSQVHAELRQMREELQAAIDASDIDAIVGFLDENVAVVWPDGAISRKREGVRQLLEQKLTGERATVQKHAIHVEMAERSILGGGDTAIAFGSLNSHLEMSSGAKLDLPGAWSATLVKADDRWLITSLHASTGLNDNPLVDRAENSAMWGGILAGALGAMFGAFASRWLARRRASSPRPSRERGRG
jgi:ketosteroid isomerase-like protein